MSRPAFSPSKKIDGGERDGDRAEGERDQGERAEREGAGAAAPARGVRPQLVGDAAAEQDEDEARRGEDRQGEGGERDQRQRQVGDEVAAEADQRPRDERADRGGQAVEELLELAGEVGLDVEDREAEHEHEAGQHEAEPGEQAAQLAAAQPPEVDAELVRLGARGAPGRRRAVFLKASSLIQPSSSTHSRLIIAICAAGPPQARRRTQEAQEDRGRDSDWVSSRAAPNPGRGTIAVPMAKLIYSMIASLDGYTEDEDGRFDWAEPDEEVHSFFNDLERPVGTHLYGRRMYETMAYWEGAEAIEGQPPYIRDFAEIWRAATRSSTRRPWRRRRSERTRIEREFDPEAVRRMKAAAERDLTIGGPELAAEAIGPAWSTSSTCSLCRSPSAAASRRCRRIAASTSS